MMKIIFTLLTGAVLALYISFEAFQQGGLFSWHPICASLGPLFFGTASIFAVRSRRSVQGIQPKTLRVQLHAILNDVAMISMVAGTVAIFINKGKVGKPHFTSWHSWVGLLTLALWVISIASAALNTVDLKAKRLWYMWRSRTHRWIGVAAYSSALATVILGIHSSWALRSFGGEQYSWVMTLVVGAILTSVVAQGLGGSVTGPRAAGGKTA